MNWLIKSLPVVLSAYDDDEGQDTSAWESQIAAAAKRNPLPFKAWFGNSDRVYIPLASQEQQQVDQDVADVLAEYGYTITDYRKGLCQQGKRVQRIGKVLEYIRKLTIDKVRQNADQYYDLEREIQEENKALDDIVNMFVNSPYRVGASAGPEHFVVISQNAHDIAMMSTNRGWTSCMQLGEGAHYQDVFCEIAEGGLIAYLIAADDKNIENSLARILIRRFVNKAGQSVAIPEKSVYGNELEGFTEVVRDWLRQKQGEITAPGMYRRKGGEWSDTFKRDMLVAPSKPEDLIKWYRGEGEDAQYSTFYVTDHLIASEEYEAVNGYENLADEDERPPGRFATREEANQWVMDHDWDAQNWRDQYGGQWVETDPETGEYLEDRYTIKERTTDHRSTMKRDAIAKILAASKGTYPEELIKEIKQDLFPVNADSSGWEQNQLFAELRKTFAQHYPELMEPDDYLSLGQNEYYDHIKKLPDGPEKEQFKNEIWTNMSGWLSEFSIEKWAERDPEVKKRLDEFNNSQIVNKDPLLDNLGMGMWICWCNNIDKPLEVFEPIPENIVQVLVNTVPNILAMKLGNKQNGVIKRLGDYRFDMIADIVQRFSLSRTDTPTVQKFYESLLPYYGDNHKYGGAFDETEPTKWDRWSKLNIETLGHAIGNLGLNGKQFLPWAEARLAQEIKLEQDIPILKEQLAKQQEQLETKSPRWVSPQSTRVIDNHERNIAHIRMRKNALDSAYKSWIKKNVERYHWIVDMLKYGKPQKHYRFYRSNWMQKSGLRASPGYRPALPHHSRTFR